MFQQLVLKGTKKENPAQMYIHYNKEAFLRHLKNVVQSFP